MRIACLLLVLASTAAAQTTRYVDPTGTDVGDCSDPAEPCRTVAYALTQAVNGDTIALEAGIYTEDGGLLFDKSMTVTGAGADVTTLQEAETAIAADARIVTIAAGTTVTIRDVSLRYSIAILQDPPNPPGPYAYGGGAIRNAGTLSLHGVTISDNNYFLSELLADPLLSSVYRLGGSFDGGGIYNSGVLDIEDCTIQRNEAWQELTSGGNGGGIFNGEAGQLTMEGCTLSENTASRGGVAPGHGGELYNEGTATVTSTEIINNTAGYGVFNDEGGKGGGIYNAGMLTVQGTTVMDNETMDGSDIDQNGSAQGAGIYNDANAVLVIIDASIVGNRTGSGDGQHPPTCTDGGDGAGIFNAGSLTMTDSIIENNVTGDGGDCNDNTRGGHAGGLYTSGTASITNSSIGENRTGADYGLGGAGGDGGGIYVSETGALYLDRSTITENATGVGVIGAYGGGLFILSSATIVNSTISGNTSLSPGSGGGNVVLFSSTASLDLVSSTITENHSDAVGGLWIVGGAEGNNRIVNSIIAGNIGSPGNRDCVDVTFPGTSIITFGHNLIGENGFCTDAFPPGLPNANNDWVGTDAIPLDPLLSPLADNGGPTLTHALLEGSVAIDNGTCIDLDGQPIETDQRGYLRVKPCDIGAFELGGIVTTSEPSDTPATHLLSLVYPNPFNPTARFTIHVEQSQHVSISLYNMVGRKVSVLHDGVLVEDTLHEFEIDGTRMASGIYFVVVNGEEFSGQLRVTLIK